MFFGSKEAELVGKFEESVDRLEYNQQTIHRKDWRGCSPGTFKMCSLHSIIMSILYNRLEFNTSHCCLLPNRHGMF